MKEYKTKPETPGQGHSHNQYRFAAIMFASNLAAILLVAGAIALVKLLIYIF